jgi:hypothetical protein
MHLRRYDPKDEVLCPHPAVRQEGKRILSGKMHVMNHVAQDHGIFLLTCFAIRASFIWDLAGYSKSTLIEADRSR